MKILVLSLTKKLRKADKTEYKDKFGVLGTNENSVDVKELFDSSLLLERELNKAVKEKYEFIIVSAPLKGNKAERVFRSKFAFILPNGERKIQKAPRGRKKGFRKKGEPIETISYERRKTRVFPVECGGTTAYTFSYTGAKVAFVQSDADEKVLSVLPEKAFDTFRSNEEEYPDGYSLQKRSVRVLTFFERHFPIKSDPKSEKVRKTVMLTALCAFIVAGYFFIQNIYLIPMHNKAIISEIQTIFYEGQQGSGSKDNGKITEKNWKKLKKINKEIVGWVKIKDTHIDYPILWHKGDTADDQYYLWRNYKQEYYAGGTTSIFMDWRSKKGMDSRNVILHGHHMEDGSMFADLLKYGAYSGNLKFYKNAPVVKISTPKGGTQTYKIFSVFKSNVDETLGEYFDFYCGSFKNDSQFLNYVYNLRIRSLINCPVNINEKDQILSLVTCSYEFGNGNNFRTIIVARKCRKGESENVDTSAATLNKSAVWPQCYYSRFGGTRPTVSTFRNEYKKGKLDWYDGTYKGKGSEQLPTSYTIPTEPETTKPTKSSTSSKSNTKSKTSSKSSVKKPKTYTIKIYGSEKKPLVNKKVNSGTKIKLPTIKDFTKDGNKYTFKKWKAKISGRKKPKYIKKTAKEFKVTANTKIKAIFRKSKIKTQSSSSKPNSKPSSSSSKTSASETPEEPEDDE